jgi:hypothetical protein
MSEKIDIAGLIRDSQVREWKAGFWAGLMLGAALANVAWVIAVGLR